MNVFCIRYYSECAVCIVITVVLITVMIITTVGSESPWPVHIGLCRGAALCRPKLRTPARARGLSSEGHKTLGPKALSPMTPTSIHGRCKQEDCPHNKPTDCVCRGGTDAGKASQFRTAG